MSSTAGEGDGSPSNGFDSAPQDTELQAETTAPAGDHGVDAAGYHGFLFADLRGYSAFVEAQGDEAGASLLRRYRTLVREAVATFRGAEIRTEGDSFYVVFESASSAVRCALALVDAAANSTDAGGAPIRIGIGVHAGESTDTAEGSVGSAVNIAARVCAVARSGEVLVTDSVRFTSRTRLQARFVRRGRHRLKGIREPVELFSVEALGAGGVATSGRSALRAWLARQPRLIGLVTAAAVALVVGVAIVSAAINSQPGATRAGPSPSPSAGVGATVGESAAPGMEGDDAQQFPNTDEQELLARLDPTIARRCRRADPSDYPQIRVGVLLEKLPVRVGLRCPLGGSQPDLVFVWSVAPTFQESETVGTYFFNRVSATHADERADVGDCAPRPPAYVKWSYGLIEGRLLCAGSTSRARIDWTYSGENLLISAERDDGDLDALYRWWLEDGRTLLP